VCWFTGYYYCTECHVNDEFVIPARILLNWDFAKYSVCKKSKEELQSAWDQSILDINEINAKLYKEIQECADLQVKLLNTLILYLLLQITVLFNLALFPIDSKDKIAVDFYLSSNLQGAHYERIHQRYMA